MADTKCSDCLCYDVIDQNTGKCKKKRSERHVGGDSNAVDGWPIVIGDEKACTDDYERKT